MLDYLYMEILRCQLKTNNTYYILRSRRFLSIIFSPRGEIKKASKQAAERRNAHGQFRSRCVLSWKRLVFRLSVWRFKKSVLLISITPYYLETVAGEALSMLWGSKTTLQLGAIGIRSPFASVSVLLSSNRLLRFSIQMASTGPSKTIQMCSPWQEWKY